MGEVLVVLIRCVTYHEQGHHGQGVDRQYSIRLSGSIASDAARRPSGPPARPCPPRSYPLVSKELIVAVTMGEVLVVLVWYIARQGQGRHGQGVSG